MSTTGVSATPAFSYAQAAKGLASTGTHAAVKEDNSPSAEPLRKDPGTIDHNINLDTSRANRSRSETGEKEDVELLGSRNRSRVSSTNEHIRKDNDPPIQRSQSTSEKAKTHSPESNSSEPQQHSESAQISAKPESISIPPSSRTDSWEKESQVSVAENALQTGEKEKAKDSEDDWEKVSVPSIPAEKELKVAPVPIVNIWQQRREAQEAKMRESTNTRASFSNVPNATPKTKTTTEEPRRKSGGKEFTGVEKEASSSSKKRSDSFKGNDRKDSSTTSLSRSISRNDEKGNKSSLPPVVDTRFWPTPEIAVHDDRRRTSGHEKSDKPDLKINGQKSHGKWVQIPFVPTAKFETQLSGAAARRGARTNTRPRDNSSRSHQPSQSAVLGDKADEKFAMPPPPLPKHAAEQDRGRKSDGQRGTRSSSLPSGSNRPSSVEGTATNFRRFAGSSSKATSNADDSKSGGLSGDSDPALQQAETSRSTSRHDTTKPAAQSAVNDFISSTYPHDQQHPNDSSTNDANARQSFIPDRKTSNPITTKPSAETGREKPGLRSREWSRDKADNSREKVDHWREREREQSIEQTTRRELRSERGRGAYRGRGGHNYNHPFTASHAYTSPLPQNGFETSRPAPVPEPKSRQSSQPFPGPPPTSSSRNNPRSHSIPSGLMYQNYYGVVPGVPQNVSPLQNEMPMYGYQQQVQLQPGIMNAMPYNDALNSYALLSMVITQIEYYFSIDNLCKDLFLRKNMDSQGYVSLEVISNFKRIKTLTGDSTSLDLLRYASQQTKNVEYLTGENGNDRIRRREGWRDFVLPIEERLPAARNDGLSISPQQARRSHNIEQLRTDIPFLSSQSRTPSGNMVNLAGGLASAPPIPYPSAAHFESQPEEALSGFRDRNTSPELIHRDAAVSPYSNNMSGVGSPTLGTNISTSSNIPNGHHREHSRSENEENIFPDENIPDINICVREPLEHNLTGQTSSPGETSMSYSTDEAQIQSTGSDLVSNTASSRISGLRGGAASPAHLDHLAGLTFGRSSPQMLNNDDGVVFFTRDGQQTLLPPPQPGQYYQTYQSLHDTAIKQRDQGIEGALEPLYAFWSNFLVDKFNVGMYEEFKYMSQNELHEGVQAGYKYLIRFYDRLLKGSSPMTDRTASDMVKFLRDENVDDRAAYQLLKAAWRNGATNLKTRKRLGDLLTTEEKASFDKSG